MKDGQAEPRDTEAEDAALWDLLGRSGAPRVSPYFARRVLRETVRLDEEGSAAVRWVRGLAGRWRLPHPAWSGALAATVVCAVSLGLTFHPAAKRPRHVETGQADLREEISPQDVEVIANLDNLMAFEENKIWTDESSAE